MLRATAFITCFLIAIIMQAQTISTTETEARAQQIVAQMSLKEKVNEMHGHGMIRFGLSIIFSKKIKPVINYRQQVYNKN